MRIGIFDSGLGGLTVFRAVSAHLPQYDYIYYGDTAHVPYGDRTEEEIYQFTKEAVADLFERGVLLAIIACNTASVESLRRIQDTFLPERYPDRKVLGVVIPTIEHLIESGAREVLLIGTKRTIGSNKYQKELDKVGAAHMNLYACATPGIVPFIERGDIERTCDVLHELVEDFIDRGGDALVLGCTHYALLTPTLRERYGDHLKIYSQDEIIPGKLELYLDRHPEIEGRLTRGGTRDFHVTGEGMAAADYFRSFNSM